MITHRHQVEPGDTGVKRVSDDTNDFVWIKSRCFHHHPRRVTFYYPASVIYDMFTPHTLHLKNDINTERIVRPSYNSSQQFEISSQKGVTTSRERTKCYLLTLVWLAIQESIIAIEDPLLSLKKITIFTLQKSHQLPQIDHWDFWTSHDMHVSVQKVSFVDTMPSLWHLLKRLPLLTPIRAFHRVH